VSERYRLKKCESIKELARSRTHHQPQSALSQLFLKRFGKGARLRKIGIVALARKLLVALWKEAGWRRWLKKTAE